MPNAVASRLGGVAVGTTAGKLFSETVSLQTEITLITAASDASTKSATTAVIYHLPSGVASVAAAYVVARIEDGERISAEAEGTGITLSPGDTLWAKASASGLTITTYGVSENIVQGSSGS